MRWRSYKNASVSDVLLLRLDTVAHARVSALADDGGLVDVVLELEQVVEGILEEEGAVLDPGARTPPPWFLIKREALRFRAGDEGLPVRFLGEDQPEVAWIDTLLRGRGLGGPVRRELVAAQLQRQRPGGLAPRPAAHAVHGEALGLLEVHHRKGRVEERASHPTRTRSRALL